MGSSCDSLLPCFIISITSMLRKYGGRYIPTYFEIRQVAQTGDSSVLKQSRTRKTHLPATSCAAFERDREVVLLRIRDEQRQREAKTSTTLRQPSEAPMQPPVSSSRIHPVDPADPDIARPIALECNSCLVDMHPEEIVACGSGHVFCVACAGNQVQAALQTGASLVTCPKAPGKSNTYCRAPT